MRILWNNILAFGLIALFAVALISQRAAVGQFLGSINNLGPGHSPEEQTLGLVALIIVTIGFIVAIRTLTRNRKP
jgi:hypothetical protein